MWVLCVCVASCHSFHVLSVIFVDLLIVGPTLRSAKDSILFSTSNGHTLITFTKYDEKKRAQIEFNRKNSIEISTLAKHSRNRMRHEKLNFYYKFS